MKRSGLDFPNSFFHSHPHPPRVDYSEGQVSGPDGWSARRQSAILLPHSVDLRPAWLEQAEAWNLGGEVNRVLPASCSRVALPAKCECHDWAYHSALSLLSLSASAVYPCSRCSALVAWLSCHVVFSASLTLGMEHYRYLSGTHTWKCGKLHLIVVTKTRGDRNQGMHKWSLLLTCRHLQDPFHQLGKQPVLHF